MNKVIVISAHPDDETLGVGGTLLKHKFKILHNLWRFDICKHELPE